jgi:thymidylate synthase (FAD)
MSTTRISVLDHGYVELIDVWGRLEITEMPGDEAIVAAARMSTGKGFVGWGERCKYCLLAKEEMLRHRAYNVDGKSMLDRCEKGEAHEWEPGDEKLLRFLYANQHSTPFEAAGATFEVMAPIFVFREWHRHRTQSYSEASSRYAPLPDVNFIPTVERVQMGGGHLTKQAGAIAGASECDETLIQSLLDEERALHVQLEDFYQRKLRAGFPKELARTHLPVSRYSRMRASANLRNWLQFLTLRQAPNAQLEIRVYADAVHDLLMRHFERTLALFDEKKAKDK